MSIFAGESRMKRNHVLNGFDLLQEFSFDRPSRFDTPESSEFVTPASSIHSLDSTDGEIVRLINGNLDTYLQKLPTTESPFLPRCRSGTISDENLSSRSSYGSCESERGSTRELKNYITSTLDFYDSQAKGAGAVPQDLKIFIASASSTITKTVKPRQPEVEAWVESTLDQIRQPISKDESDHELAAFSTSKENSFVNESRPPNESDTVYVTPCESVSIIQSPESSSTGMKYYIDRLIDILESDTPQLSPKDDFDVESITLQPFEIAELLRDDHETTCSSDTELFINNVFSSIDSRLTPVSRSSSISDASIKPAKVHVSSYNCSTTRLELSQSATTSDACTQTPTEPFFSNNCSSDRVKSYQSGTTCDASTQPPTEPIFFYYSHHSIRSEPFQTDLTSDAPVQSSGEPVSSYNSFSIARNERSESNCPSYAIIQTQPEPIFTHNNSSLVKSELFQSDSSSNSSVQLSEDLISSRSCFSLVRSDRFQSESPTNSISIQLSPDLFSFYETFSLVRRERFQSDSRTDGISIELSPDLTSLYNSLSLAENGPIKPDFLLDAPQPPPESVSSYDNCSLVKSESFRSSHVIHLPTESVSSYNSYPLVKGEPFQWKSISDGMIQSLTESVSSRCSSVRIESFQSDSTFETTCKLSTDPVSSYNCWSTVGSKYIQSDFDSTQVFHGTTIRREFSSIPDISALRPEHLMCQIPDPSEQDFHSIKHAAFVRNFSAGEEPVFDDVQLRINNAMDQLGGHVNGLLDQLQIPIGISSTLNHGDGYPVPFGGVNIELTNKEILLEIDNAMDEFNTKVNQLLDGVDVKSQTASEQLSVSTQESYQFPSKLSESAKRSSCRSKSPRDKFAKDESTNPREKKSNVRYDTIENFEFIDVGSVSTIDSWSTVLDNCSDEAKLINNKKSKKKRFGKLKKYLCRITRFKS